MKLSVIERLMLLQLLPKEGDFATLRTIRETREAVAFDEDAEEFGVTQEENGVRCTKDWNAEKEIDLSGKAVALICTHLSSLGQVGQG